MLESAKAQLRRTREFAEKHQTAIACAATAVVAVLVTRELDARIARDFAYNAGSYAGVLEVRTLLLQEFIDSKGLKNEFLTEFIPNLNK